MSGILDTLKSAGGALLNTAADQMKELESKAQALRDMAAQMLRDRERLQVLAPIVARKDAKAGDAIKSHISAGVTLQQRVQAILQKIDAALIALKQNAGLAELGGFVVPALLFSTIAAIYYALYAYNKKSDVLLKNAEIVAQTGGTVEQKTALYRAANGLPAEAGSFSLAAVPRWVWIAGAAGVGVFFFMRARK